MDGKPPSPPAVPKRVAPPPPPPVARSMPGAPPPPVPKTAKARNVMAEDALRLRDEQLRARVVYYNAESQTNAELDAITAQVVADLQQLQKSGFQAKGGVDPRQIEIELIKHLRELLEKMVSARREQFMRQKVERIQRRLIALYFETSAQGFSGASGAAVHGHADEALSEVLHRYTPRIIGDLEKLSYANPALKADAIDRFRLFQKQVVSQVLARRMPELERLLHVYRDVLLVFLLKDFRESLGELCWEVIRESRVAHASDLTYKIPERAFGDFRRVFERKFLDHLLADVQAPLAQRLEGDAGGGFRGETLAFAADPHVYAEICGVMCNAIYDYLYGEGFLDLPVSWQQEIAAQG